LGTNYFGSQYQPGFSTIQGEIIRAIEEWSGESHNTGSIQLSGRTDRGVHSYGQIVAIQTEKRLEINKINNHLPEDITIWAYSEIPLEFKPRFDVLMRHYRYYLPIMERTLDLQAMQSGLQALIGFHDFAPLCKPDGNRPTLATILNCSLMANRNTVLIDFYGTNFLWKLVRKIVSILTQIGEGKMDAGVITKILNHQYIVSSGINPAPPEFLVLVETVTSITMKRSKYALKRIQRTLEKQAAFIEQYNAALSSIRDDFISLRKHPF
jgi:tRNA pseudouridine38-40 synthase